MAFSILLWSHVTAGGIALALFWIPLAVKKGSKVHRRAGWGYSIAMWFAAATALAVCAVRLSDGSPENDFGAIFLAYVAVLAANNAATGIRVLRTKSRTAPSRNFFDLGSSGLLLAASAVIGVLGIRTGTTLFLAFAGLGALLGLGQLRFWLRPPASRIEWWFEHLGNMIAACIATLTAFAVTNVRFLGLQEFALVAWLAPGVIGGVAIALYQRHYRHQFAARANSPATLP